MKRDWSDSTVVILTCDRDKELLELCLAGIEKYWKGINVAVVHDKSECYADDVPNDLWALSKKIPFLRKVLDMPYAAKTDQIYCIDSDCLVCDEPWDWPESAFLAVPPGVLGTAWLEWGSSIWESLGQPPIDTSRIFCGGCWSAKRSEMFEPYRQLTFDYLRECHKRHSEHKYPGPVYEQCCLNGLWHMAYGDRMLSNARFPLYAANNHMAILHLSNARDTPEGQRVIAAYREQVCGQV